jgi:hypothetical protein
LQDITTRAAGRIMLVTTNPTRAYMVHDPARWPKLAKYRRTGCGEMAHRMVQQPTDALLEDRVGREPGRVFVVLRLQQLVDLRVGEGGVNPEVPALHLARSPVRTRLSTQRRCARPWPHGTAFQIAELPEHAEEIGWGGEIGFAAGSCARRSASRSILVAGGTAEHRLPKQGGQQRPGIPTPLTIRPHAARQIDQAECIIELPMRERTSVGVDSAAVQFQATVEIDPQNIVIRFSLTA